MGGLGGPNWMRDPNYPLTERWLDNALARLCKLAGIRRENPHGLRGAFNDLSRRGGADLEAASRALGHGQAVNQAAYSNAEIAADQAQRQVLESLGHLPGRRPGEGTN
jgi:integrase